MYLVDANILPEDYYPDVEKRNVKQSLLRNGEKIGVITDFSIHLILVIIEGFNRRRELNYS